MVKLPQIKGNSLASALKKEGWHVDHSRGSHVIMRHVDRPGTMIVIPIHKKPLKPGTLSNILKKAGLSPQEIKKLL
ncbi:MAG: type II toxin-antitoxin system HicA family toxin [Chloroflexota bacterium]|nr:type II toxin-antitoxin system HicA family toxin [Chloroflexota bacterium]